MQVGTRLVCTDSAENIEFLFVLTGNFLAGDRYMFGGDRAFTFMDAHDEERRSCAACATTSVSYDPSQPGCELTPAGGASVAVPHYRCMLGTGSALYRLAVGSSAWQYERKPSGPPSRSAAVSWTSKDRKNAFVFGGQFEEHSGASLPIGPPQSHESPIAAGMSDCWRYFGGKWAQLGGSVEQARVSARDAAADPGSVYAHLRAAPAAGWPVGRAYATAVALAAPLASSACDGWLFSVLA